MLIVHTFQPTHDRFPTLTNSTGCNSNFLNIAMATETLRKHRFTDFYEPKLSFYTASTLLRHSTHHTAMTALGHVAEILPSDGNRYRLWRYGRADRRVRPTRPTRGPQWTRKRAQRSACHQD